MPERKPLADIDLGGDFDVSRERVSRLKGTWQDMSEKWGRAAPRTADNEQTPAGPKIGRLE